MKYLIFGLFQILSSLLIVYEGYEEPKQSQQTDDDPMLEEATSNIMIGSSSATDQGDNQVNTMDDDSRSGNCSYDADASNDSIELNLSLDEQQPFMKKSYTDHMQTNNLPVSKTEMHAFLSMVFDHGILFVCLMFFITFHRSVLVTYKYAD